MLPSRLVRLGFIYVGLIVKFASDTVEMVKSVRVCFMCLAAVNSQMFG